MWCPKCRAEYRDGFTECSDCQVRLVAEEPAAEQHPDVTLETVFDSTNPALVGVAKTVLESAAIEFLVVGEAAASMFSGNPYLGHVRLQVDVERAEEARALLADVASSPPEEETPLSS